MNIVPFREARRRILLVEDDELLVEVLEATLRRECLDFETARTGDEALEKAHEYQPDAVLLDIELPGQSGYLVAAKLKIANPRTKVLFLTALPRGQSDRIAAFLHVDGILHKPFAMRKLVSTLDQLLDLPQAA